MNIFGKSLSAYVRFAMPLTMLVLIVGVVRLVLSVRGVPNESTRWISMNAVLLIGVVYYSIRVHTSGFGSYKHVLPVVFFPNFTLHIVAIAGILTGIVTGQPNVFTAPEFAFGRPGDTGLHLGAHIGAGMIIGALVNWGIGCLFMFIATKVAKR